MRNLKTIVILAGALVAATAALAKGERVLVTGANGQSGRPTVALLLKDGYKVRALVRDATKGADLGAGVEVAVGDVTKPETLGAALSGIDYVISTIGAGSSGYTAEQVEYQGIANLVAAAKTANVKHFVLMSSLKAGSTDVNEFLNARRGMLLMWKGKGEDSLRQSGMAYTVVRPGGLLPQRDQPPCDAGKIGLKLAPFDGAGMGSVCRSDVAALMVAALGNKDAMGKTFSVVSDEAARPDAWKGALAGLAKD
jgi:uncharacterized protein YbjT (DUF2867 family)